MAKATIANGTNGIEPAGAIQLTLQGKGGVGKSLVASVLAQYLWEKGKEVRCIDTDPVNRTFAQYRALSADRLNLGGAVLLGELSHFHKQRAIDYWEVYRCL